MIIKCVSSEWSANVNWTFAAIFIVLGITPWDCAGRRNHSWPCICGMVQKIFHTFSISQLSLFFLIILCFQCHNLAAKPFSLCVFCGVFYPLQGAVKSQLWGFFKTSAVKIFEGGGVSSPTALLPGQEGRGHTQDSFILTLSKITNHPQGYSDISVVFTPSIWKQSKPKTRSSGGISAVGNSLKWQKIDQAEICWAAAD